MPGNRFHKGDTVVLASNRSDVGRIVEEPVLTAGEYWYRVRFAKRAAQLPEDELSPLEQPDMEIHERAMAGEWGHVASFRRVVAAERILRLNRSTIYSFNARRLLFQPHQYKPLLKLLDSPRQRLLIADEVGLGKTIEAGLIMAELEARSPMKRVLVVCPSRLRQKWHEELSRRFDADFEILDRGRLQKFIEVAVEKPERARIRGIVSMATLRRAELIEALTSVLSLDLVIVDEAHHARNRTTLTSNMLRELGQLARTMVLLTATPLHLGSRDLFNLLSALSPSEYTSAEVFDRELTRHRHLLDAQRRVRACDPAKLLTAAEDVEKAFGAEKPLADPLAKDVVAALRSGPPVGNRQWVDLERRVADLHMLASIVTRTRKREVLEKAPERRSKVVKVEWTEEEARAYARVSRGATAGGWPTASMSMGQIQRSRQAASCLPAAMAAWDHVAQGTDEEAEEQDDVDWDLLDGRRGGAEDESPAECPMPGIDSKLARLLEILGRIRKEEPEAKVLVFSFFVGTTRYLQRELEKAGWKCGRIAGDVPSTPHRPQTDERAKVIREFRDDPAMKVLVSTEVGSEGLDFQFCHHVVNYDLPWNPMVVEQRIGRVDRFGQESSVVHIWSLVVEGTVEDRILFRLYERIGLFQRSIGDLESILGEAVRDLQRDYFSGRLTVEEADRRVHEAGLAIAERQNMLEKLEKESAALFGHDEYIRGEMERTRTLGRYVTERAMLALLEGLLDRHYPGLGVVSEGKGVWRLKMSAALLEDVGRLGEDQHFWASRWRGADALVLRFTTGGEQAYLDGGLELMNISHPLLSLAVEKSRELMADTVARVAASTLVALPSEAGLSPGILFLALHAHTVLGIRKRTTLEPIAWSTATGALLDGDAAERVLHLLLEGGEPWRGEGAPPPLPGEAWSAMESEARRRSASIKAAETRENEALYQRRLRVVNAEFELRTRDIRERQATARERGRGEQVQRMFEGQVTQAKARLEQETQALEVSRKVHVELSEALALCVIEVRLPGAAARPGE